MSAETFMVYLGMVFFVFGVPLLVVISMITLAIRAFDRIPDDSDDDECIVQQAGPPGTPDRERIERPMDGHIHCGLCAEVIRDETRKN